MIYGGIIFYFYCDYDYDYDYEKYFGFCLFTFMVMVNLSFIMGFKGHFKAMQAVFVSFAILEPKNHHYFSQSIIIFSISVPKSAV